MHRLHRGAERALPVPGWSEGGGGEEGPEPQGGGGVLSPVDPSDEVLGGERGGRRQCAARLASPGEAGGQGKGGSTNHMLLSRLQPWR